MNRATRRRSATKHSRSELREEPTIGDRYLILSYLGMAIAMMLPALNPAVHLFGTDYLAGGYFSHEFVSDRFAAGELPLWNPFLYGGLPHYANPGSTFYPPMLALRALLPTHAILPWIFSLHLFAAGTGMFYLVREMGARRTASYLAGVSYMLTAILLSSVYAGHDGRMIVAALAPAFFFSLHRGVRTGVMRWFVLGGAILGMALLSFQIQSNYYLLLAGGILGIYALFAFRARIPDRRSWAMRVGGGALTLGLGFGLAAVNFLPFLSYVEHSPRGMEGGRGYEYSVSWSMPPMELVGIAVPDYVGMNVGGRAYWGDNPFKLHAEYMGVWALLLLVCAFVVLRGDRRVWLWIGLGTLALLISFGGYTPIYRIFYEILPGTQQFRAPSIAFYLFVISATVLAGLAFSRIQDVADRMHASDTSAEGPARAILWTLGGAVGVALLVAAWASLTPPAGPGEVPGRIADDARAVQAYLANYQNFVAGMWRLVVLGGVAGALIVAHLYGRLARRSMAVALTAVIFVDLWSFGSRFVETVEHPDRYFAPDDVVQVLRAVPDRPARVWYLPGLPQTNYPTLYDIELLGGEHGNQLQRYNEFLGTDGTAYTDFRNVGQHPSFLAAGNVRYLVSAQPIELPFLTEIHRGSAYVYRNEIALPRAYLVDGFRVATEPDGALEVMRAEDFDPSREVVLYDQPTLLTVAEPALGVGLAEIVRHDPDEVVVRVEPGAPSLLVLADNYYPGWEATVDGQPAEILQANHTFRAVEVPEGASEVRFEFRPASVTIGLWIYGILLLLLVGYGGWLLFAFRRGRRDPDV